jgi:hypothetical protein
MRCRSLKSSSRIIATLLWTVSAHAINLQTSSFSADRAPLQDAFFPRRNCTKEAEQLDLSRTCSNFLSQRVCVAFWPEMGRTTRNAHFLYGRALLPMLFGSEACFVVGARRPWVQSDRQVFLEPLFVVLFSRIHQHYL